MPTSLEGRQRGLTDFSGVLTRSMIEDARPWFDDMSADADAFGQFHPLMTRHGWAWRRYPLHQWSRRLEYPFVLANLPDPPAEVLDAGGGVTFFTHFLAGHGYRMALCDIDPLVEPLTTAIGRELATECEVRVCSLERTPWPDESFDAACCISVLEHVVDPVACLRELARLLRPGGSLLLTFDCAYRRRAGRERTESILGALREHFDLPGEPGLSLPEDALTVRWHVEHEPQRLWFDLTLENRLRWYFGRIPDLAVMAVVGYRRAAGA